MKKLIIIPIVLLSILFNSCSTLGSVSNQEKPWSNPIIKDIYSADAAALVSGDTLYLYVGHDEAPTGGQGYVMNDWYCYSTKDMKNWENHGSVLHVNDFSWADDSAWASQVVEKDGKFYYYTTVAQASSGGMAIGVAVSDSPTGPFKDAIGAPLITSNMTDFPGQGAWTWDDIDPTVLIDDDGKAYMYFGNTYPKYVVLNDDMISFDEEIGIQKMRLPYAAGLPFTEALWIHKNDDRYFMSYAAGWEEQLAYCYSDSPTGPWRSGGLIMSYAANSNTSHQAIVKFNGKWIIFYHNGTLEGGDSFHRSVCAEYFEHTENNKIPFIVPSN